MAEGPSMACFTVEKRFFYAKYGLVVIEMYFACGILDTGVF